MLNSAIKLGCAGWSIRWDFAAEFPDEGTHLQRYAARFNAVEINSSFRSRHRLATYERWAASVPEDFQFSAKLPKQITHQLHLKDVEKELAEFIAAASGLGEKLKVILVQLPPSQRFERVIAKKFFHEFRKHFHGSIVIEPRNKSWFEEDAAQLLADHKINRAIVDPAPILEMSENAKWNTLSDYRLHGSPVMYYSGYPTAYLRALAFELTATIRKTDSWCVFDNTAEGHAMANALQLQDLLGLSESKTSAKFAANTSFR